MNWELFWPIATAFGLVAIVSLSYLKNMFTEHLVKMDKQSRFLLADFSDFQRQQTILHDKEEELEKKLHEWKTMDHPIIEGLFQIAETEESLSCLYDLRDMTVKQLEAREKFTGEDLQEAILAACDKVGEIDTKLNAIYSSRE